MANELQPMEDWGDNMEDMADSDDDDESSEGDVLDGWGDSEEESDDDDDDEDEEEEEEVNNESVHKFIRTFSNGDYDAEFEDSLYSNQALTATFLPSQASYNKPDNWVERNRNGLESVKEQLQDCTDIVSRDQSFDLVLKYINQWDPINEEPIVWHEPILDEYWNKFEANIDWVRQLEIVTKIKYIDIVNVEMKKERFAAFVAIFISGRATNLSDTVHFDNVNLCGEGIISLSKLVDVSSKLKSCSISHNRMDNTESVCCLSRSLKLHSSIVQLSLTHCDLGSNPEVLLVILQSDIKYINLSNNNIDSFGAVKIAEYLESNPPIRRIDLDNNRLKDDDAILISRALKRNTNLFTINLYSNNITSIGVKALLSCVFDVSSLNAISQSNHTLQQLWLFWKSNNLFGCIYRLLCLDRTEKILLALQDKDSLLKYLTNIPVELIPEVLAFPLQHYQHRYLSIVYCTMRWWNMPMLYSYNYCCVKSDTKRKKSTSRSV